MKVQLKVFPSGFLECQAQLCRHLDDCANHRTAGDFRMEDGISPRFEIESIFLAGAIANCQTAHRNYPDRFGFVKFVNGEFEYGDELI